MKRYPPPPAPPTPQPLDYQPRVTRRGWNERRSGAVVTGAAIGMAFTIPALALAAYSSGAGHGDYGFARGFFPIPMCIAVFITGSINLPSIAVAFLQFPLYGAVVGYCATVSRKALLIAVSSVVGAHLVAFLACTQSSNFS